MPRNSLLEENPIVEDLIQARKDQGLTLREIGERLEVARENIGGWERGRVVPALDKTILWARALGYELELVKR